MMSEPFLDFAITPYDVGASKNRLRGTF